MSEGAIEGTLAEIEDALPNGFHDAELSSVEVDWPAGRVMLRGVADVSGDDSAATYRPFVLEVSGLRGLTLPPALAKRGEQAKFTVELHDRGWCGGGEGWPPGRRPETPLFPEVWVYSFFLHALNEFVTVQARAARFNWAGEPRAPMNARLVRELNGLGFVLLGDTPEFSFLRMAPGGEIHLTVEPVGTNQSRVRIGFREQTAVGRYPNPVVPIALAGLPGGTVDGALVLDTADLTRKLPSLLEQWLLRSVDETAG